MPKKGSENEDCGNKRRKQEEKKPEESKPAHKPGDIKPESPVVYYFNY